MDKSELLETFLRTRQLVKSSNMNDTICARYRAVRKKLAPLLKAAKDRISKSIREEELNTIKRLGFIAATECPNNSKVDKLTLHLKVIEHYLHH